MRILIADDQADVRSALGLLLMQEPDLEVVAEATDAVGVLLAAENHAPTLVLLDWELPGVPRQFGSGTAQSMAPDTRDRIEQSPGGA